MHTSASVPSRVRTAFTILELTFVIAAIAILVSLAFVGFHHMMGAANRTSSASSLRQIITAWSNYNSDNEGRLLPGYIKPADFSDNTHPFFDIDKKIRNENGDPLLPADCSAYVWRLAPYLSFDMKVFSADYKSASITEQLDNELLAQKYGPATVNPANGELGIGLVPSFGYNSIFIGGDDWHAGAYVTNRDPWVTSDNTNGEVLAATRFSQIKNAASLIVFAPVRQANPSFLPNINPQPAILGYPVAFPPYLEYDPSSSDWLQQLWALDNANSTDEVNDIIPTFGDFSNGGGIPVARWGDQEFPVAHADGSVAAQDTRDYIINTGATADQAMASKRRQMHRWWPSSTGLHP